MANYHPAEFTHFVVEEVTAAIYKGLEDADSDKEVEVALRNFFIAIRTRKLDGRSVEITLTDIGYRIVLKRPEANFPHFLEVINGWFMLRTNDTDYPIIFGDDFKLQRNG